MKTIRMNLSTASINKAMRELREYRTALDRKAKTFCQRLAETVQIETEVRFHSAFYKVDHSDITVTVEPSGKGFNLVASGQAVAFIEYGAGVRYNDGGYPLPRPAGIVGIGEYGYGQGANENGWKFPVGDGTYDHTFGNPAAMPMYYAAKEMRENIERIAREVLGSD